MNKPQNRWVALCFISTLALARPEVLNFKQTVNHHDHHVRHNGTNTFTQSVYINSDFAKGDSAPVIFESGHVYRTTFSDENTALTRTAKNLAGKINAHYVYVEHRYTGNSWPTPDLSLASIKLLNTFQVIEDLNAIQTELIKTHFPKSKWVVVGASYTAEVALLYTLKYPDAVVGTYASAPAVIGVGRYLPEYSERVLMNAPATCRSHIVNALDYTIAHVQDFRRVLNLQKYAELPDAQILIPMRRYLSQLAQYGDMDAFCSDIDEAKLDSARAAYEFVSQRIIERFSDEDNLIELTPYAAKLAEDPDAPEAFKATRRFLYMTCTEHGAKSSRQETNPLTRAWPDQKSTDRYCKEIFQVESDSVPFESLIGQKLLAGLPKLRHTLIIDSSNDPWRVDPAFSGRNFPGIRYHKMDGGYHCAEFPSGNSTLSEAAALAQRLVFTELAKWLKAN